MLFEAQTLITFINVFFSIVFITHVSSIGYHILYPDVPEIVVLKKYLHEIDFPITFRICAFEIENKYERYRKLGYDTDDDFFLGKSRFNESVYGWKGHHEDGSTLASVEG